MTEAAQKAWEAQRDQVARLESLRAQFLDEINGDRFGAAMPPSRERVNAANKIDEAVMWAIADISGKYRK